MRPLFLLIIASLHATASFSQPFKEKEFKTEIKEVTVFQAGAQLFESGKVTIPKGTTILKVTGLSPYVDEKSLQVKAEGDFTILSVNHKYNYLTELAKDEKIDSLRYELGAATESTKENIDKQIEELEVYRKAIQQKLVDIGKDHGQKKQRCSIVEY